MKALFSVTAAVLAGLMFVNTASAAGVKKDYSPQECAKLDREYAALQKKEQQHKLTASDRRRMQEIDNINNIYCS